LNNRPTTTNKILSIIVLNIKGIHEKKPHLVHYDVRMPIDLSLEKSKDIDEGIIEMWRTNDSRMLDSNYRSECVLLKDLKKCS